VRAVARPVALAVAALALAGSAGCGTQPGGSGSNGHGGESVSAQEELAQRPSADEAAADYRAVLAAMRDRLAQLVPEVQWSTAAASVVSAAPCKAPFDAVEGASATTWRGPTGAGAIPDARWPEVLAEMTRIAGEHGFDEVTVLRDRPGEHAVSIHGKHGAEIELAHEANTTVTLFGGCFLGAASPSVPIVPPSLSSPGGN
jgi:hypothetical protein